MAAARSWNDGRRADALTVATGRSLKETVRSIRSIGWLGRELTQAFTDDGGIGSQ